MTELKLEVGKTYYNRCNGVVEITKYSGGHVFKFTGTTGRNYTESGNTHDLYETPDDLISEYIEPVATAQPATTRKPLVHAKQRIDHANGWDIEMRQSGSTDWVAAHFPLWNPSGEYRRKPEPAPLLSNEVCFFSVGKLEMGMVIRDTALEITRHGYKKAIRIEFNPNDQTLVSASVVTL